MYCSVHTIQILHVFSKECTLSLKLCNIDLCMHKVLHPYCIAMSVLLDAASTEIRGSTVHIGPFCCITSMPVRFYTFQEKVVLQLLYLICTKGVNIATVFYTEFDWTLIILAANQPNR